MFEGGSAKYTYKPIHPDSWVVNGTPATTKRTLNGFISRTFIIPEIEDRGAPGGLFFRRNENGTQTVVTGADRLYDYSSNENPVLNLGNKELPEVLRDL